MAPVKTIQGLYLNYLDRHERSKIIQVRDGRIQIMPVINFKKDVCSTIGFFQSKGIGKGDHVSVCLYNSYELLVVDCACFLMSLIVVPIHANLSPAQKNEILKDSDSKYLISNQEEYERLKSQVEAIAVREIVSSWNNSVYTRFVPVEPDEEEIALLMYTSGTSGESKGAMLTHKNIVSNMLSCSIAFEMRRKDIVMSFLPFSHIFERIVDYLAIYNGAALAYPQDISSVRGDLLLIRPTILAAVPRFYQKIFENISEKIQHAPAVVRTAFKKFSEDKQLNLIEKLLIKRIVAKKVRVAMGGRIRYLISGGAALSEELQIFLMKLGLVIVPGYGLTEASPVVCTNTLTEFKSGTVGKPLRDVEVKLRPDNELIVRGPNVMKGYYKKPDETNKVLQEGWLYTGDIVEIDSEGFIKIVDRKKQLLKTSTGKYVAPTPIELKFKKIKEITEAVIVGDNRKFVALIVFANNDFPELRWQIESKIDQVNSSLSSSEQIKKYTVVLSDVNPQLYTPTMKLKRHAFDKFYNDVIEELYKK